MNPEKLISLKEIKEWLLAQPDDRPIDMRQSSSDASCGCLMVQYAKEHFPSMQYSRCSWGGWILCRKGKVTEAVARCVDTSGIHPIGNVLDLFETPDYGNNLVRINDFYNCKTFGDLKKFLAP